MADINFSQGAPGGQSGAEVLSYTGNAALAGGFDSNGLPAGTGANSLATIDDMVKTINQNQFARNTMAYKQRISDRDRTLELMNDPELRITSDVLDQDRPDLERMRQGIMDTWKKTPNLMADPNTFLEFKKKVGEFTEAASSSKARNIEYKRQILQAVSDPNIQSRQDRIMHLHNQIGGGILHQIDPYFANPTFDADKYFRDVSPEQVSPVQYRIGEDGIVRAMKTMQTPVIAFKQPFSPQSLLANGGQGLQDIQLLHDNFISSPFATDSNFLKSVNDKLNTINQENKISPDSPNYFKPIAQQVDGKWTITGSPADLAAGLYAYKGYKRKDEEDLSPEYQKELAAQKKFEVVQRIHLLRSD